MKPLARARMPFAIGLVLIAQAAPSLAEVPLNGLTEAEKRTGWKLLFDGRTTDGWRNYKKDAVNPGWVVEEGILSRTKNGAGDIITRDQFESFELQLEYRISKGGNSGLMFHVTEEANTPWMTGPEIQIQDNVDGHDPQKSGWLYQLYQPVKPEWAKRFEKQVGFKGIETDDATRPAGEWNHIFLRLSPQQSEVCINGVSYYYFVKGSDDWNARVAKSKFAKMPLFGKPTRGHLCLQDHGNLVSFRNIKIRELGPKGEAPEAVDGVLKVKAVPAFPNLEWEGWEPTNDNGLLNPPLRSIHVTHAGDGTNRLFIVDQSGMIHVVPNDPSTTKAKLFADFRERTHQFKVDDEEGLLGFAFHPNYAKNGQFFLYYNRAGEPRTIYLSRFRVSKDNPDRADPDSEEVLMKIQQPFANHNGGPMAFGPDGLLYIGMGDGGGRNDPLGAGQARNSFLGCVLRIDVDRTEGDRKYSIPKDNPFLNEKGVPPEVYAYGFRNPWRVSFDRKTGLLWLADVGQDLWEEVNIVRKGGNYGWSAWEGTHAFGNAKNSSNVKAIDPVWEYDHRMGKSITGGSVYRGESIPEMQGRYVYGDFVTGKIWALAYDDASGKPGTNLSIPWSGLPVLAFGEDEKGEMYVTTPSQSGKGLFRFVKAE